MNRHGFPKSPTMPGVLFSGFVFWENETVADKHTGQYSTRIYIKRAQELIAKHAQNKVS